ncbi:MAG: Rieske 2Fe-2S domain-containing protein [Flavobacteriaceae bacterium]
MKNDRRSFLKTACAPIAFAAFGIPLLEACSTDDGGDDGMDPTPPPSNNNNNPTTGENRVITIDLTADMFTVLNDIGGWVNYTAENLLLLRIDADTIRAFDNACPHQGNRDGWSFADGVFTCSYHGNAYNQNCDGGLMCHSTAISGNTLTVTLG